MPTGVVALQAQLHQILERVYHKGRYTEGWNAHGLPFRELPAGGTGEDRNCLWRYWRSPYASDHYTWLG